MKKYLKILSLLITLVIMIIWVVPVWAYNAYDYAFTMGSVLSDGINTMEISERANYWYGTAGGGNKICYGLTTPNYNMFRNGYFTNGPRLLESGVIFLCGHANQTEMFWDDSSGNSCGLYINGDLSNINYVGLDNINLSNTSLITFAGCHTGDSTQANLTAKAVQRGATTAVGWSNYVPVGSLKNWANRYNERLSQGYTMLEAAQHANSYIYLDNRVKDAVYAGNANVRIKNTSRQSNLENENLNYVDIKNEDLYFSNTTNDIQNIIEKIKEDDSQFNEKDYQINVHELDSETYTIDFIYTIDDIYTDMGYVVTVMNNKVTKINNFIDDNIKESINTIKVKENVDSVEKNAINKAKIKNGRSENVMLEENSGKYYYSSSEGKLYYVVNTISKKGETVILDEYKEEI